MPNDITAELVEVLKAVCDDYRLVALGSFGVCGKLTQRDWKRDDPGGFAIWKRAMTAIAKAEAR